MKIRQAKLTDAVEIEQLIERSALGLATGDYSEAQVRAALTAAWGLDTQLLEDGTYFVVESDGQLAACGGWSYRNTLFGNDAEGNRDAGVIDIEFGAAKIRAFFVDPKYARRGLGSLIMHECEAAARTHGYKQLELMATLPGQRLYVKHGFAPGVEIDYPVAAGLSIRFVPMRKNLN